MGTESYFVQPKFFRPLILLASISTLVQSLVWFVLSLLGVLSYRCSLPETVVGSNANEFTGFIVYLYFDGVECPLNHTFVDPNTNLGDILAPTQSALRSVLNLHAYPAYLHGWMACYLAFNITLFLISSNTIINLCVKREDKDISLKPIRLWCVNVLALTIMDLWLTIIFGLDYDLVNKFLHQEKLDTKGLEWISTVPATLMVITARGFVLWIFNTSLLVYFLVHAINWQRIFGCWNPQQTHSSSSRGRVNDSFSPDIDSHTPRGAIIAPGEDDKVFVPVGHNTWDVYRLRKDPKAGPVEAITSFNEGYGFPSGRSNAFDEHLRNLEERNRPHFGAPRPPTPPKPRPPISSTWDYPERKNFEQGRRPKDSYH